jgi:hypothetical protein
MLKDQIMPAEWHSQSLNKPGRKLLIDGDFTTHKREFFIHRFCLGNAQNQPD